MFDRLIQRLGHYARLMRMDRPVGTLLLLWPTLWALWVAGDGQPDPATVLIFVVGTFVMRSAGCVINDYADRDIDALVERTRDRPLATGVVHPAEALALAAVLGLVALVLALQLNHLTLALAALGALLAAVYPFVKRVTHLPQFVLGVAFAWGVPMAFAAEAMELPPACWLMLAATWCWIVAYDTLYAMADRPDDLKVGVKSTAILFGAYDRRLIAVFQMLALALLIADGWWLGLNGYYYLGLTVAAMGGLYQQYLSRHRERGLCFSAFLNNIWSGAAVFAGLVLAYL